jgi:hypothetical protein
MNSSHQRANHCLRLGYGVVSGTTDDRTAIPPFIMRVICMFLDSSAHSRTGTDCIAHACRSRTSSNDRCALEPMHGSCDRSQQCKQRLLAKAQGGVPRIRLKQSELLISELLNAHWKLFVGLQRMGSHGSGVKLPESISASIFPSAFSCFPPGEKSSSIS